MRISEMHACMTDQIENQGPLVNTQTGLRSRHNRGVRRAWKRIKRQEAEARRIIEMAQNAKTRTAKAIDSFDDPFGGMTVGEFRDRMDAEITIAFGQDGF